MKEQLAKVVAGGFLTSEEAAAAMATIMDGEASPAQIGGLLSALAVRGETVDEVVGFATTMRARAVSLKAPGSVDTCGTGGDRASTFNISTIASLVAASCGVPVAKHGNRSSSGTCGSADLLEALGVKIDCGLEVVARSLHEAGWAFLFAPAFHAATRHASVPRRELGIRTAFNLLGPLTNPALPEAQVVGVPREGLTVFLATCLGRLGSKRAWVVHGSGLDELTLEGPSLVAEWKDGHTRTFTVEPRDAGLPAAPREAVLGGDARRNAEIAREVLSGEPGPRQDVVVLNAAAALLVAGKVGTLREGAEAARHALADGRAHALFERVRGISAA
jgi:anthranilate phosphoribosyltransferase